MHAMPALDSLAGLAGTSLISGIWQGFILAAVVGFSLRLVPKTSATLRFSIWSIVFLLIAVLPLMESLHFGHAVSLFNASPGNASLIRLDIRWSVAVAALWVVLALIRAVNLAVHAVHLGLLRRRAEPLEANEACAALLRGSLRNVQLCTSLEVDRPSVIGFFAPRILIPAWLKEHLTASEFEQIVLHELEHLRRGDDWLNLLQKLSLVLFPLNPILMWVERRLCFERELATDDGVLRRTKAPRAYATCLTSLAERGLDRRAVSLALGALERQSELAQRVHRILWREASLSPLQGRAVAAVVVLSLFGGAVGLARCPQLVSFSAPVPRLSVPRLVSAYKAAPSSTANAGIEHVVYRDSIAAQAAHMTLLKASISNQRLTVMPSRPLVFRSNVSQPNVSQPNVSQPNVTRPNATRFNVARKPHHAVPPSIQRVRASRTPAQGWVVLTSWSEPDSHSQDSQDLDSQSQRLVPRTVNNRPAFLSYAAVPVDGGWLILQL